MGKEGTENEGDRHRFLGCGNVGGGVWELLQGFAPEIAHRDQLSIRVKKCWYGM